VRGSPAIADGTAIMLRGSSMANDHVHPSGPRGAVYRICPCRRATKATELSKSSVVGKALTSVNVVQV
jgi:hypothetical protein